MRRWVVPLVLSQVIVGTSSGQDSQAYDVLEEASKNYAQVHTFCAQFHQVIEVTLLNQVRSGHGRMCQRPPNEFAMRFSEPLGDLIVVDGESVWTFYPSVDDQQVLMFSGLNSDDRFNFYKNLLTDPRTRFKAVYRGIEEIDSQRTHRIFMEPKEPQGFRSAIIWIDLDTQLIVNLEVLDFNESVRKIRLTDIRLNMELEDEEFRFVPPEGTRVIIR